MRNGYHPSRRNDEAKETIKSQGFYHKPAWRRIRKLALQRDHYLCQLRISPKCTRIATEVHHIKSLEEFPELALDLDNLTSCCWWCHEETKPRKNESRSTRARVICISDGSEAKDWINMD